MLRACDDVGGCRGFGCAATGRSCAYLSGVCGARWCAKGLEHSSQPMEAEVLVLPSVPSQHDSPFGDQNCRDCLANHLSGMHVLLSTQGLNRSTTRKTWSGAKTAWKPLRPIPLEVLK